MIFRNILSHHIYTLLQYVFRKLYKCVHTTYLISNSMLDNFAHLYKVKIMAEEIRDNNEELRIGVYVCHCSINRTCFE